MSHYSDPNAVVSTVLEDADYDTLTSAGLLHSPRTEVLQFVIPAGQTVRTDYAAAVDVVVQCLRGSFVLETAGQRRELRKGDVTLLSSGGPHALHGIENAVVLTTIFRHVPREHHGNSSPVPGDTGPSGVFE